MMDGEDEDRSEEGQEKMNGEDADRSEEGRV